MLCLCFLICTVVSKSPTEIFPPICAVLELRSCVNLPCLVKLAHMVHVQAQYAKDCVHEGKCAGDSELFTLYSASDKTDDICIDIQIIGNEHALWLDIGVSLLLVPEYIQRQTERFKSYIN